MAYYSVSLPVQHIRLWAEFIALFFIAPIVMAVYVPATAMFPVLFTVTAVGLALLHQTAGFRWRELTHGWRQIEWHLVGGVALGTLLACALVLYFIIPEAFLQLVKRNPLVMLAIMVFYPILSALPQEVVFRPLFFRRYGPILPSHQPALLLNAAVFSLAHLMYWNWVVAAMTFAGGLIFAWAYEVKRSFPLAVAMHAVSGVIIFVLGLGVFFFSGNVVRPF